MMKRSEELTWGQPVFTWDLIGKSQTKTRSEGVVGLNLWLNPTSSVCCQRYCSIRCRSSLYHQTLSVSFVFIIYIFLTGLRMFFLTPIVWYLQVLCVKLLNRRTEQENSNNITNFISRRTEERPSDDGNTSSHLPLRRCGFWNPHLEG